MTRHRALPYCRARRARILRLQGVARDRPRFEGPPFAGSVRHGDDQETGSKEDANFRGASTVGAVFQNQAEDPIVRHEFLTLQLYTSIHPKHLSHGLQEVGQRTGQEVEPKLGVDDVHAYVLAQAART